MMAEAVVGMVSVGAGRLPLLNFFKWQGSYFTEEVGMSFFYEIAFESL